MRPILLDDEIVREINKGIETTFTQMFAMKPTPSPHVIHEIAPIKGDVSGIINLVQASAQDQVDGLLILSFPGPTIFTMLSKIYGRTFTEVDKNVKSGVGELTNIVFGIFKANLNKTGFSFQMALPNVVYGEGHSVYINRPGKTVVIGFETPVGPFSVSLTVCQESGLIQKAS